MIALLLALLTCTMVDWIEQVREERARGVNRPLLPSDHATVNARHPGLTDEQCCNCGHPTGRAGKGEDSLYTEYDEGPFCPECWHELFPEEA